MSLETEWPGSGYSGLCIPEDRRLRLQAAWIGERARSAPGRAEDLLTIQRGLLHHYFRLEKAEWRLSARARRGRDGGRAIRQVELERERLGRELHTGVGQMLAAIRLQLELIDIQLPNPPAPARQALERISRLAHDALQQVRTISRRLQPPEWQRLDLETALRQLWDLSGLPQKFEASLRIDPLPRQPDLETKTLVYRAAQEAFSNIAQHARATRVDASLEEAGEWLTLTVRDNGAGFDLSRVLSAPASLRAGIGLRSIREQAAGLGGKLDLSGGPEGAALVLSAPYSAGSRRD